MLEYYDQYVSAFTEGHFKAIKQVYKAVNILIIIFLTSLFCSDFSKLDLLFMYAIQAKNNLFSRVLFTSGFDSNEAIKFIFDMFVTILQSLNSNFNLQIQTIHDTCYLLHYCIISKKD